MTERQYCRLEQRLGHQFRNHEWLARALNHRSASADHNERLEYVGDAVLQLAITDFLYRQFPDEDEGGLSRMRASLVNKKTLVQVAEELGLAPHLMMGPGELNTGGHQRDSTLADACEAVFGAIYLDADFDTAKTVMENLFQHRIENLPNSESLKDAKTRLQEFLQSTGAPVPKYQIESTDGPPHARQFVASCAIDNGKICNGVGSSRRKAEQAAAESMLANLKAKG